MKANNTFPAGHTYDSGLMDYCAIESAYEMVEIRISSVSEIERAIVSRTKTWRHLLSGEKDRWKTIEDLVSLLRSANNYQLAIPEELSLRPKIRDTWTKPDAAYQYEIRIRRIT